jgi:hypothetical protein
VKTCSKCDKKALTGFNDVYGCGDHVSAVTDELNRVKDGNSYPSTEETS